MFFSKLTVEDGLNSQQQNLYLFKDFDGFIWISTATGLNRFDGLNVIKYLPVKGDSTSIMHASILSEFFEDEDHNIWFSTVDALNVFIKKDDKFRQVPIKYNNQELEGFYYLLKINLKNKDIWFRIKDILYVLPNGEIEQPIKIGNFYMNFKSSLIHLPNEVKQFLLTPLKSGLAITKINGYDVIHTSDTLLRDFAIQTIFSQNTEEVWLGTDKGLVRLNLNTYARDHFKLDTKQKIDNITTLTAIDSSHFLIGTANKGIYKFNVISERISGQIFEIIGSVSKPFLYPVDNIYVDKDKMIWISTAGKGIFYAPTKATKFRTSLGYDTNQNNNFIRSITEDIHKNQWCLSKNGISVISEKESNINFGNQNIHWTYPYYTHYDDNGFLWVCDEKGLFYSKDGTHFKTAKINKPDSNRITSFTFIKSLSQDVSIASSTRGLFKWDNEKELLFPLTGLEKEKGIFTWITKNLKTKQILFRKIQNSFLVGHFRQDTFQLDTTINFKPFINYLHHDTLAQRYWLATSEGLHWIDYDEGQYELKEDTLLRHKTIMGVLREDDSDNLWLSSNRGIIKYNFKTGEQRVYGLVDGIQSLEFNFFASYKSKSGKLLFGGVNGLNIFDPKTIVDDAKPANPTITSMLVNDVLPEKRLVCSKTGNQNISYIEQLEFPIDQNTLSFNFAALDYVNPDANQFRYRMKGQDDKWVFSDTKNFARYANLPPNNYIFEVDATNSDGVWSDSPAQMRITIHPPWYQTWFAYLGYFLLGIGSLLVVYKFQINQRLKEAEAHRLKELDRIKTALYTNITHEFRTPLTIILGMADQIKNKPQKGFQQGLEMIRRSGQNLLNLVNQMLDLSKVESGNMRPQYVQGDIIQFLEYLVESFQSFAASKNINVTFYNEVPSLMMDYDIDKLQTIVTNLLSNATKFTPEKGKIIVHVHQIKEDRVVDKNWCQLKIKDNGIGIDEKDLPYIFDRFYQIDDSSTRHSGGTGIGLALTKELVELMDGNITAQSQLNIGTEFTITLPIRQTAAFAKEFGKAQLIERIEARVAESKHMGEETSTDANVPLVLIIEDNLDVITYLQACLEEEYRVSIALDGKAGIEKALEIIPDIIITDVMMPLKDGYEVCEVLKAAEQTSHIPIIMLTAKAQIEAKIEGLSKGADAYLSKPFHQKELEVRLAQLLSQRRKLQAFYSQQSVATTPIKLENPFLQKIIDIIEDDLAKDWDIEAFSQQLSMSSSQVYRKIKALTGDSTTIYIRNIRLKNAQHLLLTTNKNISEIAYSVGFNDPAFFSRSYSKLYGISPSHTRKNRK